MSKPNKTINILGSRGIPAKHGGFESFVQHFAPYMIAEGWSVVVYCQGEEGVSNVQVRRDEWQGIDRIHIDTYSKDTLATVEFDLRCVLDVVRRPGVDLVLGYNTAIFNLLQRMFGRTVLMNMDGIEWKRQKWGAAAKVWLRFNEWIGAHFCSTAIADHPQIAAHLASRGCRRSVLIPYGADSIETVPTDGIVALGLEPDRYFLSIARVEPENSILELVRAFLAAGLDAKLIVLGKLRPEDTPYHAEVLAAPNGSDAVVFPGGIYDPSVVAALRRRCIAYLHGHRVGGTNPSLVEALGAGSPVIAHDNRFNRWTAGEDQHFFHDEASCVAAMRLLANDPQRREAASVASRRRHAESFTFEKIHAAYRELAEVALDPSRAVSERAESGPNERSSYRGGSGEVA